MDSAPATHDFAKNCEGEKTVSERGRSANGFELSANVGYDVESFITVSLNAECLMVYPGIDGFLGSRASLIIDVVVVAMAVVVPVLGGSIALVKYRRNYAMHKLIQLTLGSVLLLTVLVFEIDMRINGWGPRAEESSFWGGDASTNWVDVALAVHIFFSSTTTILWAVVIGRALRTSVPADAQCT